jgi:hypothetical protein
MRPRFEAHGDTATRLPRGYRVALYMSLQDFARAQPAFLTQNLHRPAGLTSPSTSVQAFGSWNREQSLLIALWCVLIFDRLLSHLGGSLVNWGKRCCGSSSAGEASNDNGSPG